MEKLYKFARGTVRIAVRGTDIGKFLTKLAENSVEFWDCPPAFEFRTELTLYAKDYAATIDTAGRCGCETQLISAKGGKQLSRAVKRRYMFFLCAFACIMLLAASSLFVWSIEIKGNSALSDAQIIRALNEAGLNYGSFWPAISTDLIKNRMMESLEDISWITVNLHNSRAEIIVHERVEKPEIYNEAELCDIYASKSGVVTNMSVLEGMAVVSAGDTVLKGDLLVSGTVESETGDTRYVHALADVKARTWYELQACTPLYEEQKTNSGLSKIKFSLIFGKKYIKIFSFGGKTDTSCDKIIKYNSVTMGKSFALPVGSCLEISRRCKTRTMLIDKSEAIARLKSTLADELTDKIGGGEIVSSEFTVSSDGKLLTVTLVAECIENISGER